MDAVLDEMYGKVGTPERKQEKMTQDELAKRTGTTKSYISKIENGYVEPGVGLFFRIIDALGMRVEVVRPIADPA